MEKELDYKEIGRRIKEIRHLKNMTQAELAELIDIYDNSHISRIEAGVKGISLKSVAKIACVLNVSLDFLVFGSTTDTRSN